MTVKVLLPPEGKHGSYIVALDGELRVIDRPRGCKGYQNGCVCNDCGEQAPPKPKPTICECDHPLLSAGDCIKCGRPRHVEIQAREAA